VSISSRYLVRETGGNLRRNLVMTIAAVVTMIVSLAALGGVLIMRQAINKQSVEWRGGVQVAVFLQPGVSSNEVAAIGQLLKSDRGNGVKSYHYVDKVAAYREARTIFGGNKAIVSTLTPKIMPPSYRVVPTRPQDISALGTQFSSQPGVLTVSYARQAIDALQKRFHVLRDIAVALAVGVMVGAIALIVNTIQLAIFARRREVAVMKFMLEGLVHGVVGAAAAFVVVFFARNTIASFVGSESSIGVSAPLYVTPHDAIMTGILILIVGAGVGALGSAFAVRRFLQV
jgi:cell division transport system permease protein